MFFSPATTKYCNLNTWFVSVLPLLVMTFVNKAHALSWKYKWRTMNAYFFFRSFCFVLFHFFGVVSFYILFREKYQWEKKLVCARVASFRILRHNIKSYDLQSEYSTFFFINIYYILYIVCFSSTKFSITFLFSLALSDSHHFVHKFVASHCLHSFFMHCNSWRWNIYEK